MFNMWSIDSDRQLTVESIGYVQITSCANRSLPGSYPGGTCRTWFQLGILGDESKISGEFKPVRGGRFVRHTSEGTMKGKPRAGEETIVFNWIIPDTLLHSTGL